MVSKETLEEIKYYSEHPWNEKTAKDMFEELGYTRYKYNECFIEYWDDLGKTIIFNKQNKYIEKFIKINGNDDYQHTYGFLSVQELQAINKQVEELRW